MKRSTQSKFAQEKTIFYFYDPTSIKYKFDIFAIFNSLQKQLSNNFGFGVWPWGQTEHDSTAW